VCQHLQGDNGGIPLFRILARQRGAEFGQEGWHRLLGVRHDEDLSVD
jgi:hypothetical protein